MIKNAFTEHPASVGESYFEHMGTALYFSVRMMGAGIACFIHSIFPFLFVCTGRECIAELNERMVLHRCKDTEGDDRLSSLMPSEQTQAAE